MSDSHSLGYLRHLHQDVPAGVVVFFVALPLCLGIALASGAPLFSGIISGIVGGVIVAWLSGSQLSVSGPSPGQTMVMASAITQLGDFRQFLASVVLAGAMQIALGYCNAGILGAYFPIAVIKGLLAAIGLILIFKQIPHALGYDRDYLGDQDFLQMDQQTTFSELANAMNAISPGAAIVSACALAILLLWETPALRRNRYFSMLPGALVAILLSTGAYWLYLEQNAVLHIAPEHFVALPVMGGWADILDRLMFPDVTAWRNPQIYLTAAIIALSTSLETLLSLEAIDKLDPHKRVAPTNRELKAQGIGNVLSGLIGGLPMTAVIVRSSANITAGGRTKVSSFVHGLLLAAGAIFLAESMNDIPLACLASVLLFVGYKLARPALFIEMYRQGPNQFLPFAITVASILLSDLLKGMAIGMAVGLYFVIRTNFHRAISFTQHDNRYLLRLHKGVSFLNKAVLRDYLARIEANGHVVIDGSRARFIDHDIIETISDFLQAAKESDITVELAGFHVSTPSTLDDITP